VQRLVWPTGTNIPVTAYLWGGGGGGGGFDARPGGAGSGGGFTEANFSVSAGDVIEVAVGGGGAGGPSGATGGVGGVAGASYVSDSGAELSFNTRSAATSPPVVPSTNSAYVSFLNTYGVWVNPITAANFDRSYVVNFPSTTNYTFTASADNSATLYLDGTLIGTVPGFTSTVTLTVRIFAGNHTIRIVGVNTGGPGSVALTINGGGGVDSSFSGGSGGRPGTSGTSGGGGGGGGATVIFKNGTPVAVAGGGGGGGGGGRNSAGDSAPGSRGQAASGESAGQNGQDRTTDGGGGGGGGGGLGGGNGGLIVAGDSGANAGSFGLSSGPSQNPSGRTPGGTNNPYYRGQAGVGGGASANGSAGVAVLLFDLPGSFVHTGVSFVPIQQTWINVNGAWQPTQAVYIKNNGVWASTVDSFPPTFSPTGNFGVAARPITPEPMPPDPPAPPPDTGGSWGEWSPDGPVDSWGVKDNSAINTLGGFNNDNIA
jgi:hypothetical protein